MEDSFASNAMNPTQKARVSVSLGLEKAIPESYFGRAVPFNKWSLPWPCPFLLHLDADLSLVLELRTQQIGIMAACATDIDTREAACSYDLFSMLSGPVRYSVRNCCLYSDHWRELDDSKLLAIAVTQVLGLRVTLMWGSMMEVQKKASKK